MPKKPARRLVLKGLGATLVASTTPLGCNPATATRVRRTSTTGTLGTEAGDTGVPSEPVARDQMSVLYISADELNPNYLGHRGHPLADTPNLDALAAQSLQCTKVYTSSPVCAPTRSSLLTGLYPLEHGQFTNAYLLSTAYPTLSEYFTEQGFQTACFGKLHTNNGEDINNFGFQTTLTTNAGAKWEEVRDRYVGTLPRPTPDADDEALFSSMPFDFGGKPLDSELLDDDYQLVQEALAWLREHQGQRFFLYVSLRAPHYPFNLPRDYYYRYDPADIPLPDVVADDRSDSILAAHIWEEQSWGEMTDEHIRLVLARYLGSIAWLDHLVGLLLSELQTLGLDRSTVVAFTSDHGDMCGEKGLWLKNIFFESAARKPLLVRMPGYLAPGSEDDVPLGEVDLWPTMAGLVNAAEGLASWEITGRDHSDVLLGTTSERPAFAFSLKGEPDNTLGLPWVTMAAGPRYKLWRYRGYLWGETGLELYDLETDPLEQDNIINTEGTEAIQAEMNAAMDAWLDSMRVPLVTPELAVDAED